MVCSIVSNSLQPTRLLCLWNFPGKNIGVGCHFLLQGIFQTHGSNLGLWRLLNWQVDSLPLVLKSFTSDWDLNPAKTHSTWFQELRFLMSHHRKNSVTDKVIGKKWIYSDTERSTLQTECGPSQRVNAAAKFGVVSFYKLGNFICCCFPLFFCIDG